MQDGRSARAQRPRRLMTAQFTHQIARDTSVDSLERDGLGGLGSGRKLPQRGQRWTQFGVF